MSGPVIVRQLVLELGVRDAFALVATLDGLRRWLPVTRFEPRVGAPFALVEQGRTAGGEVLEVVSPRRVVVSWDWVDAPFPASTTVSFELEPLGPERTALRLTHAGLPTEGSRDGHAAVWDVKLAAVPRRTAWHLEESVLLAADPALVFAIVADPLRDPDWCPRVDHVVQVEGTGPAVGARYHSTHRPIPMPAQPQDVELLALDPPRAAVLLVRNAAGALLVGYELEQVEGGTRLTERDSFALAGPARLLTPAFLAVKRRRVRQQFAELGRLLLDPRAAGLAPIG